LTSQERVLEALNFVSTIAYSIANDIDKPGKVRLDASLIFLKSEAWIAKSEQEPLVGPQLESLQKALELN